MSERHRPLDCTRMPRDDFHRCFVEGNIKQIGCFSMQFRKRLPWTEKSYSLPQLVIGN
jgi:hypothetical protein